MVEYNNSKESARIRSVEFASIEDRQFAFVRLSASVEEEVVRQMLAMPPASLSVLSSTHDEHGDRLLVCHGDSTPEQIVTQLRSSGEILELPDPVKAGFNPWLWRGITSIVGQSLQVASGLSGKGTAADRYSLIGFGTLNLMANASNIIFGAQEKNDPYQLRMLKKQVNESLRPHVSADTTLPDIDGNPLEGREKEKQSFGQKTYDLMQQYSVSFGEIGLRTLGATQLSFPFTNYKQAARTLRNTGSIAETVKVAKNTNPVTFAAGLMTLLGKFTSMVATEPDPYNPKPSGAVGTFREKIAFPLSSVIEGAGAAYMTHDRFANQKMTLGGKTMPDYLGGVGNAVFVGGYGIRLAAPYGSREVDMPQLYAHISEGLTRLPGEARAKALAEAAVQLKRHFSDKPLTVSEIYAAIAEDLQKNHHIRIEDNASSQPEVPDKENQGEQLVTIAEAAPENRITRHALSHETMRKDMQRHAIDHA